MNKFSLALFDLDGTLADTSHDMVSALNRLRARESLPEIPYEQLRPHVSGGTPSLIRLGFGLSPGDPGFEPLRQDFLKTYERNICERTVLFPHMDGILQRCEETGVRWGIITNKPEYLTLRLLRLMEIDGAAVIIGGDTLPQRKPHPMPVLHACKETGIEPESTVMIGDAKRDVDAGTAAGAATIAVSYGYIPPEENPAHWGADALAHCASELHGMLWR